MSQDTAICQGGPQNDLLHGWMAGSVVSVKASAGLRVKTSPPWLAATGVRFAPNHQGCHAGGWGTHYAGQSW